MIGAKQRLAILLVCSVVFAMAGGTWAASDGGIPLGATPVDLAVMSGGRAVVLLERMTVRSAEDLKGSGVPQDAASILLYRIQADGRVWMQGETVLHREGAVRTDTARGFSVEVESFTAIDPSHLVVAGYSAGAQDRVFVLSHRFGGIFDVSGAELRTVSLLNSHAPMLVEGDPFMAFADLNTDGTNDLVLVTPADRRVRVFLGEGGGRVSVSAGSELASYVIGMRGDEPRAVDVVNLSPYPDYPRLGIAIVRGGILSDEVTILMSRGDGGFSEGPSMSATMRPRAVVAGDFTNNSIPDLIVVGSDNFVFLRGLEESPETGLPRFAPKAPGGAVSIPDDYAGRMGVAAADFNLDGNLDIAIPNMRRGTVDIWLGNGDGTFRLLQQLQMASGALPIAVALSDINGNGLMDLVIVNQGTNELVIRMARGDGTFSSRPDVSEWVQFPGRQFAVADLRGLGATDLIRAFVIDEDAGPSAGPVFTRRDEGIDVQDRVILHRHQMGVEGRPVNVSGTSASPIKIVLDVPGQLSAGNASLGGASRGAVIEGWLGLAELAPDVTAGDWLGEASAKRDDPSHIVRSVRSGFYPTAMAVGDLTGDGADEVVAIDSAQRSLVVMKQFEVQVRAPIRALFDYPKEFPFTHALPLALVLADVDPSSQGDEVLILNARSRSAIVVGADVDHDAVGRDQLVLQEIGYGWIGRDPAAAVSLWSDAGDEVVIADYSSNSLYLLTRNGQGSGHVNQRILDTAVTRIPGLTGPVALVAWQVPDAGNAAHRMVAVIGHESRNVVWLRRQDRAEEPLVVIGQMPTQGAPYSLAAGDFDGDGIVDLAVTTSEGLELFFGSTEGTFTKGAVIPPDELGGSPLWVGGGDINLDGYADLIVCVGRFDEHGAAVQGLQFDDVWVRFGPIER